MENFSKLLIREGNHKQFNSLLGELIFITLNKHS